LKKLGEFSVAISEGANLYFMGSVPNSH
jgi:hypothetical protein